MPFVSGKISTSQSTSSLLRRAFSLYATRQPPHPPVDQGSVSEAALTMNLILAPATVLASVQGNSPGTMNVLGYR